MSPVIASAPRVSRDQALAHFRDLREANRKKVAARRKDSESKESKKRLENKNKIAENFGMKYKMEGGRYVRKSSGG